MKRIARLPLAALLLALCGLSLPDLAAAQEPTVVVLVRHAEKAAAGGQDPELSAAGTARAGALAAALAQAGVDAVVTTQLRRTQLTARPLMQELGLRPEVVPAGGPDHPRAVADAVRRHAGRTVLVVGHSNTVPAIVTALGAPPMGELCDHEYSNLFIMVLRPGRAPTLVQSRYGAPDPAPTTACTRSMRQ
ncbi:MAG TPA: phosphoglycerate mutase family protein [Longimicrobiaceae bacterium]|nr:phosphoglycerate mutase family protein [Longimicrobiaceae bacterium]